MISIFCTSAMRAKAVCPFPNINVFQGSMATLGRWLILLRYKMKLPEELSTASILLVYDNTLSIFN